MGLGRNTDLAQSVDDILALKLSISVRFQSYSNEKGAESTPPPGGQKKKQELTVVIQLHHSVAR